jgi:polysaccharide deacetylase 2 family uncharacterized protein YibQ
LPFAEGVVKFPKLFGKKKSDDDDDDFEDEDVDVVDLDEHFDPADEIMEDNTDADAQGDADDAHADLEDEMVVGGELESDEIEFDNDDDDEEDGHEDDEASSRKKAIMFAALGMAVVLLSALGGAGWWILSAPSETASAGKNAPGTVEMSMPAVGGTLNARTAPSEVPVEGESTMAAAQQSQQPAEPGASASMPAETEGVPAATLNTSLNSSLNSSLNDKGASTAGGGLVLPAVASSALARIPDQSSATDQSQALANAPVRALLEEKNGIGELPKIGPNQVASWQVYSRPIDPDLSGPRIALMIEGIGLSRQASLAAINKLPPEVSMILSPYGRDLNDWVFRARLAGHEVFMSLPMESENFPMEDPGPLGLDTRIQVVENERRLETVMAQAGGYVGLVTFMGSRYMKAEGQLTKVLGTLKNRGLMFVVGGNQTRNDAFPIAEKLDLARMQSRMYIDDIPRIQQIRTNLDKLESLATDNGAILAIARPYPVTIKSIVDWVATLKDRTVKLVPASAVATYPATPQ